jgi:hypothetical protein
MNHDSQDFEDLRRLIALKRHENPPPGYFNQFSREVCARIKAGEQASDPAPFSWLFQDLSWLQRLWATLETKPVLAGAVGVAACAFLFGGIVYSTDKADFDQQALVASPAVEASAGLTSRPSRNLLFEPAASLAGFQMNNTFGTIASQGSLFPVQQVNFLVERP